MQEAVEDVMCHAVGKMWPALGRSGIYLHLAQLACLSCTMLSVGCWLGDDPSVGVSGQVVDEAGAPVGGAEVTLTTTRVANGRRLSATCATQIHETGDPDSSGLYILSNNYRRGEEPPLIQLRVRKEGFKPYEEVIPEEGVDDHLIVLKRESQAGQVVPNGIKSESSN